MDDIDTRLLRSFLAVANHRSFSAAGSLVGCSQGTMSTRIRSLENQLGTVLFERDGRQVALTQAGGKLLPFAREFVDMHDKLVAEANGEAVSGVVRLGVAPSYASLFLPGLLKTICNAHPDLELRIVCQSSWRLRQMIEARTLDLAVATVDEDDASGERLCCPPMRWVSSPDFDLRDHEDVPVVWLSDKCFFRSSGTAALRVCGMGFREVLRSPGEQVLMAAIGAGIAVTILAEGTIPPDLGTVPESSSLPALGRVPIRLLEKPGRQSVAAELAKREIVEACRRA